MCRYLSAVASDVPSFTKTNLMLPMDLATALDEVLPFAKQLRYVGRNDKRNDLIRYLLERGVAQLRAEMVEYQKPKPRRVK